MFPIVNIEFRLVYFGIKIYQLGGLKYVSDQRNIQKLLRIRISILFYVYWKSPLKRDSYNTVIVQFII